MLRIGKRENERRKTGNLYGFWQALRLLARLLACLLAHSLARSLGDKLCLKRFRTTFRWIRAVFSEFVAPFLSATDVVIGFVEPLVSVSFSKLLRES